jgi:hypothetical protein
MSENALASKMKLKPGHRAAIIGAPDGYLKELQPLPPGAAIVDKVTGQFDWIQVFVRTRAEAARQVPLAAKGLKPASLLWVSFPKASSGIQTDLTRDRGWETLKSLDLMWVNLISVNDIWSAFSLRPYKPGEKRRVWR